MKNITKSINELSKEMGMMSITEFVIGKRFKIHVTESGIDLSQDEEHNKKFGGPLDLETFWKNITTVYNIDSFRLMNSPLREYVLHCIYYDADFLKNIPQIYPGKGIIVVEVEASESLLVPQEKIEDFCRFLLLPSVKLLYSGTVDRLGTAIAETRSLSSITRNKLSGGIVIKNEPPQHINGEIVRWFIEPNYETVSADGEESPGVLAKEFVEISFGPEKLEELFLASNKSPVSDKKEFIELMLFNLKSDHMGEYIDYKKRCAFSIGDSEDKFDAIIRDAASDYIDNVVSGMNKFASHQSLVEKKKRGRPKGSKNKSK